MNMRTGVISTAAVVLTLAMSPATAEAGDRSFSSLAELIQSRYNGKRQGIPLLGLARFAVRVVKPAGVKNFKLVMLKDLDLSPEGASGFHASFAEKIDPVWRPLVRYAASKRRQWTYVYAQHLSKDVKLLIVTLQQREAYIVQLKFSPERLIKFMEEPSIMGIPLKNKEPAQVPAPKTN
jgi:hypothetical protein